jgi:ABC-type branched-subunit amino acid transport system substrate-binding protein
MRGLAVLALLGAFAARAENGVTDSEVLLGEPAAFRGPSAGLGVEMWRGAFAAFSAANENGGVNRRSVKLVLVDDGYEAERAAPAALQLIVKDKVFALFGGVGTPTIVKALPVVLQYNLKEGLFYFANFTGAQPQREPPYDKAVFNVRASYRQETKAAVDAFVAMGRKKIGIFVQDDAYGASGRDGVKRALKEHGLDVVADTTYQRGQKFEARNDAQVKILTDAGANAIVMVGAYQGCGGMVRDLRNAGWNGPIHNVSFVGADQMLRLLRDEERQSGKSLTQNLLNTQVVPSYDDLSVPAVKEYREAIDRYTPSLPDVATGSGYQVSQKYTFGSLEGYVSARMFLAVLQKSGRELTRKGFYETAEKMGKFDVGLGTIAEFDRGHHQALDKVWWSYAAPDGWRATGNPASVVR